MTYNDCIRRDCERLGIEFSPRMYEELLIFVYEAYALGIGMRETHFYDASRRIEGRK